MRHDSTIGEIRRSMVLGAVADLPTRREAQLRLDERLHAVNQTDAAPMGRDIDDRKHSRG